ncbi:MAG: DUF3313 family protein [Chromatiales bacterium]|nr:DUF3313 family protein [Chromatiales bacterium]
MTASKLRPLTTGTLLAAGLAIVACTPANPVIVPDGPTWDGMVPVRDSGLKEAWIKPDINLSSYEQMLLLPIEVQFRAVRPTAGTTRYTSQDREFPLSAADQKRLVDMVTDVFREELAKSRHLTLTTAPGPDVLLVRASLVDIVSKVPPEIPGRNEIFLDEVGEATLVLELQDSQSGEMLARAVDRRAADPVDIGNSNVSRVTSVEAWSEVRRVARRWASVVTQRIDQLHTRGRMPGQDPGQPLQ